MPASSTIAEPAVELTSVQKLELVERVAASEYLRRAIRLREFLLYVGKASAGQGAAEIREQDIGIHVFGRAPDYDRGADNIVRVNATELRKRIELYFTEAGADEPYVFQIPRGAYRPVFSRRAETKVPAPVLPVREQAPPVRVDSTVVAGKGRGWIWLSLVLGLLCVALLVKVFRSPPAVAGVDAAPMVMQFWRTFTRDNERGSQTDIVLSDESLSLMEDILRRPVSLPAYVDRSYVDTIGDAGASDDRRADVREILRHNLVTLGSVMAAQQILVLPGLTQHFHITVPRLYPPDLMKRNNLIILGGKKSNPWASLFDDQLNFTLEYDQKSSQNFVLNHAPRAGEPGSFEAASTSSLPSGVAVIAYIPNRTNTGEVMLLTGSDSDATAAAAEFITSETSVEQLAKLLGKTTLPHFELVLRTSRLSGTSFASTILATRVR